ncbi:MAG TPA: hypothetical protein VF698_18535 [Thermoanaerobaculia bacterium]
MIGEIIRLLMAAACGLFVLSVPLSKTQTGATLRRWAGVCFVLAFLPSIVCGLFYSASSTSTSSTSSTSSTATTTSPPAVSPADDFFSRLGCVTVVVIAAVIAYGILKLRSRLLAKSKPRDPWETLFNRGGGKRPFTINPKATRSRAPFVFDDDEDDD